MKGLNIKCKYDGKEIIDARTNQLFCSTRCKNSYHNKNSIELYGEIKVTNKILITNLWVVKSFYNSGKIIVTSSELRELGHRIEFMTEQLFIGESRQPVFFTYQYGIQSIGGDKYKIICKDDEI
ncbi:MAG: hypothetical protein HN431_11830 [Bacteroidetes bacterium]|jgi:hypothetical protein|nr:hypothetical protein [Bacteroidota bacterium]